MIGNRIHIECNGADIILAADKITSMLLQPMNSGISGIIFYVLDITTVSNAIISLHSDPRDQNAAMYLNSDALLAVYNNFWGYLDE